MNRQAIIRGLKQLADIPLSTKEAAKAVGLQNEQAFCDFIDHDPQAKAIWSLGRQRLWLAARASVTEAARRGSRYATSILARILEDGGQLRPVGIDPKRVSTEHLARLFGVVRQTIHDWNDNHGLPRNDDQTYDIADAIAWYHGYCMDKGFKKASQISPELHRLREEQLAIRIQKWRGRLFTLKQVKREIPALLDLTIQQRRELASYIRRHRRAHHAE